MNGTSLSFGYVVEALSTAKNKIIGLLGRSDVKGEQLRSEHWACQVRAQ